MSRLALGGRQVFDFDSVWTFRIPRLGKDRADPRAPRAEQLKIVIAGG